MKLINLLRDIIYKCDDNELLNKEISDIKIDHRKVEKGDVFIAMKGVKNNGNDFIKEAFERGAVCVVSDELEGDNIIHVPSARSAYALMSKNYFGRACDKLRIIAITGTNGKTTTCNVIADMLKGAGYNVGTIGTLGVNLKDRFENTGFTTPDPYMLHYIFSHMLALNNDFVVMEASAHALALNKLDGIKFEVGVLTNITEDHLDFFGDMDSYAKAKFKLFEEGRVKVGVYCKGKPYSDMLERVSGVRLFSYGTEPETDFYGQDIKKSFDGTSFECLYGNDKIHVNVPLVGQFNVENTLASISVCRLLGINDWSLLRGLSFIRPVEGRFNIIKTDKANVVIDYAHTPDGLENVLTTAREISTNKVVVVFGCGGNRDRQKRPIMGRVASQLADEVILTSDNPRYENPYDIIAEIKEGVKGDYKILANRKDAIKYALKTYVNGETIVIAGKGAEKYQEIKGEKLPFSDFDVVRDCVKNDNPHKKNFYDEKESD